ncbi:winged helix DNA-binding domain-containing protein [Serinicoccus chungangensis]|uniref:winged helix DNA-binding domain-containing protein n=1 Tax=Serinicoccus chungangensis TaxID=767452 RepID=UPI00111B7C0E|nr:winged helix DNA-binding domain-containing protein [Serinicoccus chungangensis]
MTRWTTDDVARMRLLSQRLVEPLATPGDVVRHLTCVQGQDYPGSTTSIALRTRSRRLAEVREAYDAGEIVRSWPMRGTLFVVPAEDLRWMLGLTSTKILRETTRRREQLGLDEAALGRAEDVARSALAGGGLTRAALLDAWERVGHPGDGGRGYHSLFHLALRGIICQGPTEGREQRFVLTEEWISSSRTPDPDDAVREWFVRYVRGHGPVPAADFLWWTKLLRRDLGPVLGAAREELEVLDVDGVEHWVDPAVVERYAGARRATAAPLLLPGFDELMLGYGDRRAVVTREEEAAVVPGGNGVFRPTVVRAGRAVGTWRRPTRAGAPVTVEAFGTALPGPVERALPRLTRELPA